MADTSVIYLLQKTENWLSREFSLPEDIKAGIRKLGSKLKMNSAFIKDMDGREEQDNQIQEWIQQIRDVTCKIEIVLDMYAYQRAQQNVPLYALITRTGFGNHYIDNFIKKIEADLDNIRDMKDAYPVSTSSLHSASTSRDHGGRTIAPLYAAEVEIVGVGEPRSKLVSWVLDEERAYKVMFVVGMGGSGKTALVKVVYEQVKTNFDCHVWLTASDFEQGQQLLSTMVDKLCSQTGMHLSISSPTLDGLINMLNEYLRYKRYLIVLDDLWNGKVWESVKYAFPRDNCSRVIITTRRGDIASSCRENYIDVYKVEALPSDIAQDLFYRRAFSESGTNPSESSLLHSSEKLLDECEGLPLGIIEIGKLVSSREISESSLRTLHGSLQAELTSGKLSSIKQALLLSYSDLPYHLKSCFLYMSMFPVSHSVKHRMLIRLWIAEGFIERVDGKTLEDIGEEYLKELMDRNLIQASEWDFDGSPKTCRLHNLMHKIAPSKSEAGIFCKIGGKDSGQARRISIQNIGEFDMPTHVHTLITSGINLTLPQGIGSSMRLLKILHLDNANLDAIPSEIRRLLLLKYLSLRQTRIKLIPETIERLKQLETLNLKQTFVTTMPKQVENLAELRHLVVSNYNNKAFDAVQGFKAPTGISKLTNLQKLSFVKAGTDDKLIRKLQNLTELRKLGIIDLQRNSGPILCNTIQKLGKLHSLSLTSLHKDEVLNIQEIERPPPLLKRLCLWGRLEMMPGWILQLHDLVRIRLRWSRLTQQSNPILILGELANLLELQLVDAYTGNQLDFDAGTFPKLKILEVARMEELKIIMIDKWALPRLEKLIISHCWNLSQIPVGIDNITQLKELHLKVMLPDFVDPLRRDGQMRHLVKDIKKINYWHRENDYLEDLS